MSLLREPSTGRGEARLIAESPPGVDIEIIDAGFKRIAAGVSRVDLVLPEGLYTVRFSVAGAIEERAVRLLPIEKPLVVKGGDFALESAPPSEGPGASAHERRQAQAFTSLAKPPRHGEKQEIVIFVRAPDERTRSDVSRSLRLFDSHDADVRPIDADEADRHQAEGWGTRRYTLAPGSYRLRYESSSRRMAEQTISVFQGRRTYAFLQYGSSVQVERSGAAARPVVRRGVDAALTTLVSSAMADLQPDPEQVRLADILLHAIRSLSTGIDPEVVESLARRDACPYLQIYASAALTRRLEVARAGPEDTAAGRANTTLPTAWMEGRIEQLLACVLPGRWPDVQAIGWRLSMLRVPPGGEGAVLKLRAPPMLDCSWRWAAAFSVDNPDCLPTGGAFEAATGARVPAGPWLAWSSAAARSSLDLQSAPSADLAAVLASLTSELRGFAEWRRVALREQSEWSPLPTADLLRSMTPDAQEVAAALLGSRPRGPQEGGGDAHQIASYLGAPARALGPRLTQALEEVRKLKSGH
jgi:hypothetical protein